MTDVLERIFDQARRNLLDMPIDETAVRRLAEDRVTGSVKSPFIRAMQNGDSPRIIAEIKAASPSEGSILEDPDAESIAASYREGGAAAISVVTERTFFRGSLDWLGAASKGSMLPVLMKDFILEAGQIYQGVAAGADAVLLLASHLSGNRLREFLEVLEGLGRDGLVEVHDEHELDRAIEANARMIGINNRDLRSFQVDLSTGMRLVRRIPVGIVRVAESGIKNHNDVERLRAAGFDAFLVGESMLRQRDRARAVRELRHGAE